MWVWLYHKICFHMGLNVSIAIKWRSQPQQPWDLSTKIKQKTWYLVSTFVFLNFFSLKKQKLRSFQIFHVIDAQMTILTWPVLYEVWLPQCFRKCNSGDEGSNVDSSSQREQNDQNSWIQKHKKNMCSTVSMSRSQKGKIVKIIGFLSY